MQQPDVFADPATLVSDLSLNYPAHAGRGSFNAVEGVSFQVQRGGVLAVLGESGSGKSTLTRFLAGRSAETAERSARAQITGGEAVMLGIPMRRLSRRAHNRLTAYIGYLDQEAGATLPPDRNVGELLLSPFSERTRRFDRAAAGERIAEMMDLVGLPLSKLQAYPYELSKGQRQRIAVVHSLVLSPPVYIADEPTLGVDATSRPKIVELLRWYREQSNATMLLVSHDIGVLEALVHNVVVMQQGQLVGHGDINEIFRNTDHVYVQQLARALRSTAYDEIAEL